MRRKRKPLPAVVTDPAAALPEYRDDLSAPLRVRKARWNEWYMAFEAWQEKKAAWYEAQGVEPNPQEYVDDTNLIPDEPFDGSDL